MSLRRDRERYARQLSPDERREVGLNHDGRPWGIPRMHINRYGEPKPCLTRENAIAMALAYTMDPDRVRQDAVDAYQCDHCPWWHIGTRRPQLRKPTQCVEVGDRVWWNLKVENTGSPAGRLGIVVGRFRRQGREAIDPGNKAAKQRRDARQRDVA